MTSHKVSRYDHYDTAIHMALDALDLVRAGEIETATQRIGTTREYCDEHHLTPRVAVTETKRYWAAEIYLNYLIDRVYTEIGRFEE